MKNKFKKIVRIDNIPYFLCGIIALIIFANTVSVPGDDFWFSEAVDKLGNGSLAKYLEIRYESWTGRIIIESIMVTLFKYNLWIWRILNTIIFVTLCCAIYRLIPKKYEENFTLINRFSIKSIICISMFLIHKDVFISSIKWITGSFNYLWPMTCAVIAILPLKHEIFEEKYNNYMFIVYMATAILAGNMEQASLVILCFALISNIYLILKNKKANITLVMYNVFFLINTAILFLAPGNYVRSQKETITWFGQWDMISLPTKIMIGLNLLLDNLFNRTSILMFILTLLVFIVIYKRYYDIIIRSIAFVPLSLMSLKIIEKILSKIGIGTHLWIFKIFNVNNLGLLTYDNFKLYLPTVILLGVLLLLIILMFIAFNDIGMKYISVIMYLAAICSGLSISVSPTIYASGARIFFVTDIIVIILITLLLTEQINKNIYKFK